MECLCLSYTNTWVTTLMGKDAPTAFRMAIRITTEHGCIGNAVRAGIIHTCSIIVVNG